MDGSAAIAALEARLAAAEAETAALRADEQRYRALFDSIDEGFCVIEVLFDAEERPIDYRFLEANPAFERQTGLHDAVGRAMRDLAPDHEQYWFDIYGRIALTGEPARFEHRADALGRWYDVYAFRIDAPEQHHVAVLFRDVMSRRQAEAEVQESEERQAFLLKLSDVLRPLVDPIAIQAAASQLTGEHLGAKRAAYGELEADELTMTIAQDWHVPEVPSTVGRFRIDDAGTFFTGPLRAGRISTIEDTATDPRVDVEMRARIWDLIGIRSAIAYPIIKEGRFVAAFFIHHDRPRIWTAGEIALVAEVTNRTWDAVQRARAEAAMRKSEERLAAVFESVPVGITLMDAEGNMLISNTEAQRFLPSGRMPSLDPKRVWRWHAVDAQGNRVPTDDFPGARARRGLRTVPGMELIYTVDSGEERWTSVSAVPLLGSAGAVTGIIVAMLDIDTAKRAEVALRENRSRLQVLVAELQHRVRNILTVVRSVLSRSLDDATDLADAINHFRGRLDALARTQVIVTQTAEGTADLEMLVRDELLSVGVSDGPLLTISGPRVALSSKQAETLGLAVHELTTNALKYGALKVDGARLDIVWEINIDQRGTPRLHLSWCEQGVPAIPIKPQREGFGRELIEEALPYRLGAETRLEFRGGGVRCSIVVPLDTSEEATSLDLTQGADHDGPAG